NAMVCSDDPPQPEASFDQSGHSDFALFTEQVFASLYVGTCSALNVERLPDESDVDATLDVPTLVLSGRLDVRTPTFRNQEVADMLPNSRIVIFEYGDHVQYRGDDALCAASIVSAFVIDPTSLNDLDTCCAETSPPSPTLVLPAPTIAEVIGTEFMSTGVYLASSQVYLAVPEGSTYSITFTDAGQLKIVADCNTITASYVAGDRGAIRIELGASTRVACPEGSIADDFLAEIESASKIELFDTGSAIIAVLQTEDGSNVGFTALK
ncbi:MAG: alpha/beta hydrolase, partial [Anaerolineae bacterium]|nr:alpha/beta hydrolase [Anaerolineae bacterium]